MIAPTKISGLDLLLGGGIRLEAHAPGAKPSVTILIRGPAGAGKTILATQLANALSGAGESGSGRAGGMDVAYGCIEVLPSELTAQRTGLALQTPAPPIVTPPFGPGNTGPRTFASILDLGDLEPVPRKLPTEIDGLLNAAKAAGGQPAVVVVDSLSTGYGVGSTAPRFLADETCKLAIRDGIALILVEEAETGDRSVWPYVVDVVVELGFGEEHQRRCRVVKNRLGRITTRTHEYEIASKTGVSVFPDPAVFDEFGLDVLEGIEPLPELKSAGTFDITKGVTIQRRRGTIFAVSGSDAGDVRAIAQAIEVAWGDEPGLWVDFEREPAARAVHRHGETLFKAASPFMSAARFIDGVRRVIRDARPGEEPRRAVIGDLARLRSFAHRAEMERAILLVSAALRRKRMPVILFDSSAPVWRSEGQSKQETIARTDSAISFIHDVADVSCELVGGRYGKGPIQGRVYVRAENATHWF
jgi:KaiC/GvpD/RAD55 family RecA-like ATPase